jgi:hypothetical protein
MNFDRLIYMEVSGQLHAPGKSPRCPFDMNLAGLQSRSGRGCEEKKFH